MCWDRSGSDSSTPTRERSQRGRRTTGAYTGAATTLFVLLLLAGAACGENAETPGSCVGRQVSGATVVARCWSDETITSCYERAGMVVGAGPDLAIHCPDPDFGGFGDDDDYESFVECARRLFRQHFEDAGWSFSYESCRRLGFRDECAAPNTWAEYASECS